MLFFYSHIYICVIKCMLSEHITLLIFGEKKSGMPPPETGAAQSFLPQRRIMKISDRMQSMNPSAVREILKVSADISFSAGNPSPDTFPAGELATLADEIFRDEYAVALQYGLTEGYGPLRDATRKRMSDKYGIGCDTDDIIITSGGQQAIDLATKCLTNEGDTVICENPSFVGALNDFRSNNTRLVGVPVKEDGMDLAMLERALDANDNVKLIYTIPTFQNPSGVTMSLENRERMYNIAVERDIMIIEDSPYFELRYSGEYVPSIKSLDKTGHVIFAGSYSKIISPGMRVGFAIAPQELISKMTVAKQCQDVHSNLFFMMLVNKYLERYDIDRHILQCCELYSHKRDLMIQSLEKNMPDCISFTRPDGGLFIWGELPEGYSGTELCKYTARRSLAIVPGMAFDPSEDRANRGFRLNFSVPTDEQILLGIRLLGESIAEYLKSK